LKKTRNGSKYRAYYNKKQKGRAHNIGYFGQPAAERTG
jgi:hypothetical protein